MSLELTSEAEQYASRQERTQSWSPIPEIVVSALQQRAAISEQVEEREDEEGMVEDFTTFVLRWQIW